MAVSLPLNLIKVLWKQQTSLLYSVWVHTHTYLIVNRNLHKGQGEISSRDFIFYLLPSRVQLLLILLLNNSFPICTNGRKNEKPFKLQARNCYFDPSLINLAVDGCHFATETYFISDRIYTCLKTKPESAIYFVQKARTYSPRLS